MAPVIATPVCDLRIDPLNRQATLIAPKRAKRPLTHEEDKCPGCFPLLCPPAVYIYPPDDESERDTWEVRVVPNKFSSFSEAGENQRFECSPGFSGIHDPAGRCEVVFETRHHYDPVYARTSVEIRQLFRALVSRYKSARSDPNAKYWFAFKNLGRAAGGTLDHEHWQLYTLPFIPPSVAVDYECAALHYSKTGRNLYRSVFEDEASSDRAVVMTEHFLTFCPFASRTAYEICIAPRRISADFSAMTENELLGFATSFRDAISRLNSVHPDCAYNVLLHTAFEHASAPWYCWHLKILTRLATPAGVELGIGTWINPISPEEAAAKLRSVG
jgi:UDPglucose--hexose-1-phosphate uridylyltransferase